MGKLFQKKGKRDWTLHNLAMEVTRVTVKQGPRCTGPVSYGPLSNAHVSHQGESSAGGKELWQAKAAATTHKAHSSGDVDQVGMVL